MRKTIAFVMLFLSLVVHAQTGADRILFEGLSGAVVGAFLGLVAGIVFLIRWALAKAKIAAKPKVDYFKNTTLPEVKNFASRTSASIGNRAKTQEEKILQIADGHFETAADEISQNIQKPGLWLKALTLAEGDEKKQRAIYIRLRAKQLSETTDAEDKDSSDMQPAFEEKLAETKAKSQPTLEERLAENQMKARQADFVKSLEKVANDLTTLKIYASRGADGSWRVHRPDGTVWTADNDSVFLVYAKRVFQEETDSI